jgi:sphingolipid delta-4 desaturase
MDALAAAPAGAVGWSAQSPTSFARSATPAGPHAARRKAILAAHPEIRALFGACWRTKWTVLAVVALQFGAAHVASQRPAWQLALLAWSLGGLLTSNLFLAAHEASHNLAFATPRHNKLLGLLANAPVGIPFSIAFAKYHAEHHSAQGQLGVDCDLPHQQEASLVSRGGWLAKAVWLGTQLVFYALRPPLVRPKMPGLWDGINWAFCVAVDVAVWRCAWLGPRAAAYLLLSVLLGGGLHPAGAHFIAEHYMWPPNAADAAAEAAKSPAQRAADAAAGSGAAQETFSYYGPWNALTYHVGYHNEHHDFPAVPGSRLAAVRAAAPEFYSHLRHHTSYSAVIYAFVFDHRVGPFSRVTRAANKLD